MPDFAALGDLSSYVIFVNDNRVNLEDLVFLAPGGIVRVNGDPSESIMIVPTSLDPFDRVAGMISENP